LAQAVMGSIGSNTISTSGRTTTSQTMATAPLEMAFQLVSPYPEAKTMQRKAKLTDYVGKPVIIHLYTS